MPGSARLAITALIAALGFHAWAEDARQAAADSLTWRRLVHQLAGSRVSEVTNPEFFVDSRGRRDPRAELDASLLRMASDRADQPEEERFPCQFPARDRFLRETFGLPAAAPCPRLEVWRGRAEPESIHFVYASQFIGNPASAFGHSFLRFDRGHRAGLLGYAVSFFARANPEDNAAVYAAKGMFGGYVGEYQLDHYYPKARGYGDGENRDLWEYRLKLTATQRRRVFDHSWELARAGQTPYYFLDRNCTYQLLRLLEVADPSLDLTSKGMSAFATPQESVKVLDEAGLIEGVQFRPSLRRQVLERTARLNAAQRRELAEALSGRLQPDRIQDAPVASALVATLSMNDQALLPAALRARARLPATAELKLKGDDPRLAHKATQIQAGVVSQNGDGRLSLGFRPALHSLDDRADGYLPHTQMMFFNSEFRARANGQIDLRQIDFVDIKSLTPDSVAWTARAAMEPVRADSCVSCRQVRVSVLGGFSGQMAKQVLGFVLLGPTIDALSRETRLAPSLSLGSTARLRALTLRWEERWDRFLYGKSLITSEFAATLELSEQTAFGATAQQKRDPARDELTDTEIGIRYLGHF